MLKGRLSIGFTLIELLLVIAIFALVTATAWPVWSGLTGEGSLRQVSYRAGQMIRQAQERAYNGLANSRYGIKLFADRLVLFQGENYNSRQVTSDQILEFDTSGLTAVWRLSDLSDEIIFSKGSGLPSANGQITLIDEDGFKVFLNINQGGLVEISGDL